LNLNTPLHRSNYDLMTYYKKRRDPRHSVPANSGAKCAWLNAIRSQRTSGSRPEHVGRLVPLEHEPVAHNDMPMIAHRLGKKRRWSDADGKLAGRSVGGAEPIVAKVIATEANEFDRVVEARIVGLRGKPAPHPSGGVMLLNNAAKLVDGKGAGGAHQGI
jgi:hypothetical protein